MGAHGSDRAGSPGAVTPFTRRLYRDTSQLRQLRDELDAWLAAQARVPDQVRHGIVLAVNEAVANGMEHAYADGRADRHPEVRVDAEVRGRSLRIRVRDRGAWRTSIPDGSRGRGLVLMRSLADHVQVERREDGTDVTLAWRWEAETAAGGPTAGRSGPGSTPEWVSREPRPAR